MKKPLISITFGMVMIVPLALLTTSAHAVVEAARVERPAVGEGVREGAVEHPLADADAVRIRRDNLDYDNDGVINANDPDDDNDGILDADDPDDDNDGTPDAQDTDN